jgi:hypothetical protein
VTELTLEMLWAELAPIRAGLASMQAELAPIRAHQNIAARPHHFRHARAKDLARANVTPGDARALSEDVKRLLAAGKEFLLPLLDGR